MTIEAIGSFLPDEKLTDARQKYNSGIIDHLQLTAAEDVSIREIVDRQIACNLPYVTSGELRRKHWANDFWFGLKGISCKRIDSGHIYQPVETSADNIFLSGRIGFNPRHPFFADFIYLFNITDGRAGCRQTLPSPANLLLEMLSLPDDRQSYRYPSADALIEDITETYRLTLRHLYQSGCASVQFDDTACGLMCDDNFTKRLLQGGIDLIGLHRQIINVINGSLEDAAGDMETSIYLSGGDTVVPEWEFIRYSDNIMPAVLSSLKVDKFFLPFDLGNDYAIEILRHVPAGKKVVLGLAEAHSPLSDDNDSISMMINKACEFVDPSLVAVSHKTGFKLSSYPYRGLTYEDQWRKIIELSAIA